MLSSLVYHVCPTYRFPLHCQSWSNHPPQTDMSEHLPGGSCINYILVTNQSSSTSPMWWPSSTSISPLCSGASRLSRVGIRVYKLVLSCMIRILCVQYAVCSVSEYTVCYMEVHTCIRGHQHALVQSPTHTGRPLTRPLGPHNHVYTPDLMWLHTAHYLG